MVGASLYRSANRVQPSPENYKFMSIFKNIILQCLATSNTFQILREMMYYFEDSWGSSRWYSQYSGLIM